MTFPFPWQCPSPLPALLGSCFCDQDSCVQIHGSGSKQQDVINSQQFPLTVTGQARLGDLPQGSETSNRWPFLTLSSINIESNASHCLLLEPNEPMHCPVWIHFIGPRRGSHAKHFFLKIKGNLGPFVYKGHLTLQGWGWGVERMRRRAGEWRTERKKGLSDWSGSPASLGKRMASLSLGKQHFYPSKHPTGPSDPLHFQSWVFSWVYTC